MFDELRARADAGDENALFDLVAALDKAGRSTESLDVLARAAQRGNALARLTIGMRIILGGVPQGAPADAVRLITESAHQDCAPAIEMLSLLIGIGYAQGTLDEALDLLMRAAELGSHGARAQLLILSGDRPLADAARAGTAAPADVWPRLRKTIDLQQLLNVPEPTWLSTAPRIGAIKHFIGDEICDWLIERSRQRLGRAQIYASDRRGGSISSARTNTQANFSIAETDFPMVLTQRRMALAVGLPFEQVESVAVLHYSPGEEFTEHYDFLDPNAPNYQETITRDGDRVVTCLIYLNEDYSGGETAFPDIGLSHKGARGEALFFFNTGPDGKPEPLTKHAGRPPVAGEKWVVSQFIRNRPMIPRGY